MKLRIAVVYPSPGLDTTQCLDQLVRELAARGHRVDVFSLAEKGFADPTYNKDVSLTLYRGRRRQFVPWLIGSRKFARTEWDVVIAIDRMGLVGAAAALAGRHAERRALLIYFNVELYLPPIFSNSNHRWLNRVEAWLARNRAVLTLSPSSERAEYLSRWYQIPPEQILVIPNSPSGPSCHVESHFLRQKYCIKPDSRIVLYLGSLTAANRIEDLISVATRLWPEDLVLVLHGRQRGSPAEQRRLEALAEGSSCRVLFSTEPLPLVGLRELAASADVGLAMYPTEGVGFQTMGTASGKIALYLQQGVPVITTRLQSLERLFARHPGAGICVDSIEGIPAATGLLTNNTAAARAAARQCFDENFLFDTHFDLFYLRLLDAVRGRIARSSA